IEDHCGEWSLAKPLQTSHAIWNNLDLISFRGKQPLQNLPQSTIVLDDQKSIHFGWSQFGHWSVQSCCQGSGSHKLFLFLQNRRSIHNSPTQRASPSRVTPQHSRGTTSP